MAMNGPLVSFGTGAGSLCFYDVRGCGLLPRPALEEAAVWDQSTGPSGEPAEELGAPAPRADRRLGLGRLDPGASRWFCLETGPGWLDQNEAYW